MYYAGGSRGVESSSSQISTLCAHRPELFPVTRMAHPGKEERGKSGEDDRWDEPFACYSLLVSSNTKYSNRKSSELSDVPEDCVYGVYEAVESGLRDSCSCYHSLPALQVHWLLIL